MLRKVVVANRGEIALRVMRGCRELGIATVAVFSEADADALHVRAADEAFCVGPASSAESYLRQDRILAVAKQTGADAIHPGYGFLSENAAFTRKVEEAGLVFVGPPANAMDVMGDKLSARRAMEAAGVPVVPGTTEPLTEADDAAAIAADIGYPVMIKASAGGGGKGMRRVDRPEDLDSALRAAKSEAGNSFGDDKVYVEKFIENPRHVEVQVFSDTHGNHLHLFERDCSIQRRNQKLVEETPCPVLSDSVRDAMTKVATRAAAAIGYVGAGTVEFLLGADGAFYFLEMNTRLQVEHPVTEEVFGLDLVALQLSVAEGHPLPFDQGALQMAGHAIEVRLYAEDPARGYLPQPAPVHAWVPPPGIRVDAGLGSCGQIDPAYDPMVAKLIAHGPSRDVARRRLLRALSDTVFFGGATNRELLRQVLAHPTFVAGEATTDFLDAHAELADVEPPGPLLTAVAAALWWAERAPVAGPLRGHWFAHDIGQPVPLHIGGDLVTPQVRRDRERPSVVTVTVGDATHVVEWEGSGLHRRVTVDAHQRRAQVLWVGDTLHLRWAEHTTVVRAHDPRPADGATVGSGTVTMPMSGQVLTVSVAVGEAVVAGQVLATVEAMKLETPLRAPYDGVVTEVHGAPGQALSTGSVVVVVQEEEA